MLNVCLLLLVSAALCWCTEAANPQQSPIFSTSIKTPEYSLAQPIHFQQYHKHHHRLVKRTHGVSTKPVKKNLMAFTSHDDDVMLPDKSPNATLYNFKLLLNARSQPIDLSYAFSPAGNRLKMLYQSCTIDKVEEHHHYQKAHAYFDEDPSVRFVMIFVKRDYSSRSNYERFIDLKERLRMYHPNYMGYAIDTFRSRFVIFVSV